MTATQINISTEPFALPASFAQQRLWFLDRLEPDRAVYNVPLARRLHGPLNVGALRQALDELSARHESLRTVFSLVDEELQQLILPSSSLELRVLDLSGTPDAETRLRTVVNDDARQAFDLETGPLLRASLIKLGHDHHVLLLTAHHIIVDAWSMSVLSRELSALYGGLVAGTPAQLPELAIQYGDYAVWQQEWMRSGGLDQQLDYWREQLAGAPGLLELPTDHPRPARQRFRGATVRTMLPPSLRERVRALGEREGATMFMTLLGAFAVLLSRYSGQEDLVVASPVANRNRVELESVIGLLVNTLALRVDLEGDPSFAELVRRVRGMALGAFSNQDLPFEKLVEELNPERHLSHGPVAQVLFVLQSTVERDRPATFAGLSQERLDTERGTAKFDLSFFAAETAEGLRVSLEYCSDLFEEATAVRMLEQFRVLLEAAVADPARSVSELPLLGAGEQELVLRTWNQTERDHAPGRRLPIHELVAEQARRTPDLVAVESGAQRLSYAQLDTRANQLAAHLRGLGVGPDVVVAICAERSIEMVVGVLATLKAGGAYAPIDPSYPEDRVAFMLADTAAPVLLTQQRLLDRLPQHQAHAVCLDTDWDQIAAADDSPPSSGATLENLAYVIYTSGSTGRPKGVAMSHRPLANLLAWQLECWSGTDPARTLQFASLSFDVAFQEIFSTLVSGGTLVLTPESVRRDPGALLAWLEAQQVQRLFLPFVALQNLCDAAGQHQLIPSLREVITAGEQLKSTDSIRGFFARHPGCTLVNQYGPTESHVVTAYPLRGAPDGWPALPPIGRPIANTKIYLLDRHQQPVPIGVPGELHIGGTSLARGYLGRPALTAERFLPDPFDPEPGARIYRTGDLARYRPDGNIEYLGRTDDQVKVRGYRVELGEIESALAAHPSVGQAAVALREDNPGDVRLVGYVTVVPGTPVEPQEILGALRQRLPGYMVPQHLMILGSFPLTPTGKIQRRALPTPDGEAHTSTPFAQPTNELEAELVGIWQRVLKLDRIGIDDNFFELGGHSLLAVQLVHAVENELDRICALPMLFRTGTVRTLAAELRAGGADVTTPTVLKLRSDGTGTPIFCISGVHVYQELVDALGIDAPVYGIFLPYEQEMFEKEEVSLSIEEMAAGYLEVVRAEQPHGPYVFLGLSVGGLLIYEMAHQLERAGETVSLLVIFDTIVPGTLRDDWKRRVRRRRVKLSTKMRIAASAVGLRAALSEGRRELLRLSQMRVQMYNHARRRYQLHPYSGRAVLVRSETTVTRLGEALDDPTFGWGAHVDQLEIYDAVGDHITHLRRPHVHALAAKLRPHIELARVVLKPPE